MNEHACRGRRVLRRVGPWLLLVALLVAGAASAQAQLTIFEPKTPATAEDVNANFTYVDNRIETHVNDASLHSDVLAGLTCADNQVAKWVGDAWECADDVDTDTDTDTLGALICAVGQVPKRNAGGWICGNDVDTNSGGTVTSVGSGTGLTGGPITGSGTLAVSFGGNGIAGSAARSDHNHDTRYSQLGHNHDALYEKLGVTTIVVHPDPGDPLKSGAALLNATDKAPCDIGKPCLIKLEPGVYDLDAAVLRMKPEMHIEGSGQDATRIIGAGPFVILGAEFTELRFLNVEPQSKVGMVGGIVVTAIAGENSLGPRLKHVTVLTTNPAQVGVLIDDPGVPTPLVTIVNSVLLTPGSLAVQDISAKVAARLHLGWSQVTASPDTGPAVSVAALRCMASVDENFDPLLNCN